MENPILEIRETKSLGFGFRVQPYTFARNYILLAGKREIRLIVPRDMAMASLAIVSAMLLGLFCDLN